MYAVIETGGKQYRVTPGAVLEVERLEAEAGKPVTLDRVLLVSNEGKLNVGNPTVSKASVVADVVEHLESGLRPTPGPTLSERLDEIEAANAVRGAGSDPVEIRLDEIHLDDLDDDDEE